MKYKVVVMDMDGTLLNSEKKITKKTFEMLMKYQEKGGRLVLASGRPQSGLVEFAKILEMDKYDGYLISFNGARLYSCKEKKTIWERVIPQKEASAILDHLENYDVIPMINDDETMYVNNVFARNVLLNRDDLFNIIEYESRSGKFRLCEKASLGEFLDFDLFKILVAGDPSYLQEIYKELEAPFEGKHNAMFTAPFYFEFTNKEADKGLAMDELSTQLSIPYDEIVGFGDDMNDLPYLTRVGLSVVMENGNPKVKEIADVICESNDDDGIGKYLEKLGV